MIHVSILAGHGCMASSVTGLLEMLQVSNMIAQHHSINKLFSTRVLSWDGNPVTTFGHFPIIPDGSARDSEENHVIMIPSFIWTNGPPIMREPGLQEWLINQYAEGSMLCAMCTGVFTLADTGLLNGRPATTNWIYKNEFQKLFPKVLLEVGKMVTEADNLICSGTVTAAYRMILHIVEKFGSREIMLRCARTILLDPTNNSQVPFMRFVPDRAHGDNLMMKTQTYMENHYSKPLDINLLSDLSGICARHFQRRFKKATGLAPGRYLRKLRLEKAKSLLEETNRSISEITWQIGYEDPGSFSKYFKNQTGLSPLRYRETFGPKP